MNFGLFSLLKFHPYYVSKFYENQFYTISMFIAVNTLLMPVLSVYLLKKFRFVDNFEMSNPKQRLFPYSVVCLLIGFTMYQLYRIEMTGMPLFFLGSSALCIMLNILINLKFKISSHAIGAGGLIAFYGFLGFWQHVTEMNLFMISSVLAGGIICWSRLYLEAHSEIRPQE